VNLSNTEPTKCINQLALDLGLNPISREILLARTFNTLENFVQVLEKGNDEKQIFDKYHKYWLHGNQIVKVRSEDGTVREGKIISLDYDGFLLVQVEGNMISVHPDGNSFDMLQGLIIPKK
jgi:biotin--protein ligase